MGWGAPFCITWGWACHFEAQEMHEKKRRRERVGFFFSKLFFSRCSLTPLSLSFCAGSLSVSLSFSSSFTLSISSAQINHSKKAQTQTGKTLPLPPSLSFSLSFSLSHTLFLKKTDPVSGPSPSPPSCPCKGSRCTRLCPSRSRRRKSEKTRRTAASSRTKRKRRVPKKKSRC